jgi:eukaryotic-like serine/threonine-protein kinase
MSGTPDKLGKYELRGTLGRGAMGIVYDGWDPLIDRRVAIKTVRLVDADDEETAEALARFKREAQAAGRLTHPNIVGVYDYGEVNDVAFIVMEFASGKSLKTLLDEQRKLPPAEAVRIMQQVLAGLAYSHARGVVHRDIKPGNIIIVEGGQVKIADFGIARIESSSMTSVGTVMGTPAYMPPEQFLGEPVDARSDLYAAGVMTFQLLSGQRPYEGSMTTIMQKVLNTVTPPPVSARGDVPASFDPVVARAMARVPADRFVSAEEFATALRDALANINAAPAHDDDATVVMSNKRPPPPEPLPAVPETTPPSRPVPPKTVAPPKPAKRSAMPLVLGGVALLVLAGAGGAYVLRSGGTSTPQPPAVHTPTLTPAPQPVPEPAHTQTTPPSTTTADVAKPPPPAPDPAVVRGAVAAAASSASCSVLTTVADSAGVHVGGFVGGRGAEAAARSAVAAAASDMPVDWQAHGLDAGWCKLLDVLRPAATGGTLSVALADGATRLRDGEQIKPVVTGPSFASWMEVDYFAHDGTVVHFYPTAAAPLRKLAPGDLLRVNDKAWVVGPPYGTDLVVASAVSNPLFRAHRPVQESQASYLEALRRALAGAVQRGDSSAVGVGVVETEH